MAVRKSSSGLAIALARLFFFAAILYSPWAVGSVPQRFQLPIFAAVGASLICWLLSLRRDATTGAGLTFAGFVLLVANAWCALQLAPLPRDVVQLFSPEAVRLRAEMAPGALSENAPQALSLSPAETRQDLSMLILATAAFFLGGRLLNTSRSLQWFCWTVATNGAVLTFIGLVQKLTPLPPGTTPKLLWFYEPQQGTQFFASFVNQNHAGNYLNLCLAAAIGAVLWSFMRSHEDGYYSASFPTDSLATRMSNAIGTAVGQIRGSHVAALLLTIACGAGVICSLSRGAIVSLGVTVIVTMILGLFYRQQVLSLGTIVASAALLLAAAAGGIGLAYWMDHSNRLEAELATLTQEQLLEESRIGHWQTAVSAARPFLATGTGLGTHKFMYGAHDPEPAGIWFDHAENQYVETLVVAGVPGLFLLLLLIGLVAGSCRRLLLTDFRQSGKPFGIVASFALVSQVVHSGFDFGTYIPAIALLFATICGAAVGRARTVTIRARSRRPAPVRFAMSFAASLLPIALIGATAWAAVETRRIAAVHAAYDAMPWRLNNTTLAAVAEARDRLRDAIELRPDDGVSRWQLAQTWIRSYRWQASAEIRANLKDQNRVMEVWRMTQPDLLQVTALQRETTGDQVNLAAMREHALIRDNLKPAYDELLKARSTTPVFSEIHKSLAELAWVGGAPNECSEHLDRAAKLAQVDADVFFLQGLFAIATGDEDRAWDRWKQSLTASREHEQRILKVGRERLPDAELITKVLPDSPDRIADIVERSFQGDADTAMRLASAQRGLAVLDNCDLSPKECLYLESRLHKAAGQYEAAITSLEQAISADPRYLPWRQELALLLLRIGETERAEDQALYCVHVSPETARYRQLLRRIQDAKAN